MSYQLQVVEGPNKGKIFTIFPGQGQMIGRSPQSMYQLDDPRISRNHTQILVSGETVSVICNKGSGGTLVNGVPIQNKIIQLGSLIKIGDTVLRLEIGDRPISDVKEILGQELNKQNSQAASKSDMAHLSGTMLGRYKIGKEVGKGSTCTVFQATNTSTDKEVALKILKPDFCQEPVELQRFIRAMKTVFPLRHPNIISVFGAGKEGNYCWIAMEYAPGENLAQVLNRLGVAGKLDWKFACQVALQIGKALEYAHQKEIIHRNLTPKNIIWNSTTKNMKLGDLMKAKALEDSPEKNLTNQGELVGDLQFMSPEQARGDLDLDARTDIYGLGATCYALIAGRPPVQGGSLIERIINIRTVVPEKLSKFQMSVSPLFEGLIMKCLAKDPIERFQSATDLTQELGRIGKTVFQ